MIRSGPPWIISPLTQNQLIRDFNGICKIPPPLPYSIGGKSQFPHTQVCGGVILKGQDSLGVTLWCPPHPIHTLHVAEQKLRRVKWLAQSHTQILWRPKIWDPVCEQGETRPSHCFLHWTDFYPFHLCLATPREKRGICPYPKSGHEFCATKTPTLDK